MAEQKKQAYEDVKKTNANETSIVRIAGRDVNGNYKIEKALMRVKGIKNSFAHAAVLQIEKHFGIARNTEIGSLEEESIEKIEKLISKPLEYGIPSFLLNRRNDAESGDNRHLVGTDLTVVDRQDVDRDVKVQSWRGFRHQYGQKVRGQRTRSTGRTGATVGVTKKAAEAVLKATEAQQKKGATATTAGAEKPAAATSKPAAEKSK